MAFDFTNIKAKGKLNGLSSFSSLPAEDDTVKITPIPIDMIDPYTESLHPFKSYTVDKIDELAESIKVNGLLQPIIVSRKSDGRYMIIAGHNRFRACQKNNMDTIDAVIRNELTATQRIKIHYADIADSVMGLPKEEIEPLVRWLLTNNQSQIADYCNDKGFISVAETTADSDAESIDGILMDDEEEFKI